MRTTARLLFSLFALLLCLACGEAYEGAGRDMPPVTEPCATDGDCPTGLVCRERACVADDDVPPETPDPRTFLPPASTASRVFALSPDGNVVSVIDPRALAVQSIPLPAEPLAMSVLPGEEAIVVLSRAGGAISLLSFDDAPRLSIAPLPRRLSSLSLAPDGSWALAWTRDGEPLDSGVEGAVVLADLAAVRRGEAAAVVERVAGRRHTDVFFRSVGGAARDAVVVGKEEIAVFDLEDPADPGSLVRIELPAAFAEIATRRVAATGDGAFVLLASVASQDLLVLDVSSRSLRTLPLPGAPTDLAVSADGGTAVLALRTTSRAAWLPLPAALDDPSAIRQVDVSLPGSVCESPGCTVAPGQVRLSADGAFALLFTTAQRTESFGRLDLVTGAWTTYERLRKEVRTVAIAPTGTHAIVIHEPRPDSTDADPYEREVDRAHGYSVVTLVGGASQLVVTGDVPPVDAVFAPGTRWAGVTLRGDAGKVFRVDAVDLETLMAAPLPLPSAPEWAGPLATPLEGKIWVTQKHPAGRISFVDLEARTSRTITGYELNGEIE
ncbi:MAG TPA: hypothetical protein VGD74_08395 [Vulgatibacter sp.]